MIRSVVSTLLLFCLMVGFAQEKEGNPPEGMVLIPGGFRCVKDLESVRGQLLNHP